MRFRPTLTRNGDATDLAMFLAGILAVVMVLLTIGAGAP